MMNRPPFSWSKSRKEMFDRCHRQYWYHYYGYWGGWTMKANQETRLAYFLKNLVPLDGLVGTIVHETIKDFLIHYKNTGEILGLQSSILYAGQQFAKIKQDTLSKKYRNTKKTLAIQEFNYNELTDSKLTTAVEKINENLINFDSYFAQANIDPQGIVLIDDIETGFIEATVKGVVLKIYAVIDFAYKKNDILNILDWKTGDNSEEKDTWLQSVTYGLYAHELLEYPFNKMHHKVVNLNSVEELDYDYVEADYKKAFDMINLSILEMLELDNVWQNESRFYVTNDIEECKKCAYREICPKMKGK